MEFTYKAYNENGGFVTFTVDAFSDIEILSTAQQEETGRPGGGDHPGTNAPGGEPIPAQAEGKRL